MHTRRSLLVLPFALALAMGSTAQNTLKDGTTLVWDKVIAVGADSLRNDSVNVPAFSVPVHEASAKQVSALLKTVLPGASFRKQGRLMKATGVTFAAAGSAPVDVLARVTQNKKQRLSTLSLAFLNSGTSTPVGNPALSPAVRDLGVQLNKAVVQQQVDAWTKKLGKAHGKTESAAKSRDKARKKLNKAQSQVEKNAKERSKLQNERAIMQREIDLYNEKWMLGQDPKDLKKLTKARSRITKNEARMAKLMANEAKAQRELSKTSSNLPDVQQEQDAKAAARNEVQRTVDALQRKLENIR